ncbi:FHA domain-containing protein [Leptolyngbya ohadii]|uniref:FHA domain-containing protein n=1 Tax=Leptolyngbya ohadii TaxID=1962290 RepID=UPI000B5A09BD|nr:FHA domain-containing protein [Leptolyngbya ohadii]
MPPIVIRYSNLESEFDGTATLEQQLGQTSWTIGRDETCDLPLPLDHAISGFNSLITFEEGRYWIIDQHSTNGTRVNGSTIRSGERVPLEIKTRIEVGQTTLLIKELQPLEITEPQGSPATDFWQAEDVEVECIHIDLESLDTKTFWFAVPDRLPYFSYFQPGQFGLIEVNIDGMLHSRAYSISSAPSRPFNLTFTIKKKPGGIVSTYFYDCFQVGDRIVLKGGPMGAFTCMSGTGELINSKLLFIGAGSGMTPLASMTRWLYDTVTPCDVILMQSARTPIDLLFHTELSEVIARKRPEYFRYLATLTGDLLGFGWSGVRGRINSDLLRSQVPDLMERDVFVCGPNGFMQAIEAALQDLGFPMAQLHQESFGSDSTPTETINPPQPEKTSPVPASQPTTATINQAMQPAQLQRTSQANSHVMSNGSTPIVPVSTSTISTATKTRVMFMKSHESIDASGNQTILELAEQAGVNMPAVCRAGTCKACKSKVRGQVEYKANCSLSDAEKNEGWVLTCIAKPVGTIEVER